METKRFDRIVAILIHLQSRKIVKAKDLADRFQVSLRTIYRDIRSLEQAGVPIYSEAGSGYELMDHYKLPPVMFTQEEAMSFIAAEKLVGKYVDRDLSLHFMNAMFKIKSVLKGSEKEWLQTIESTIVMSSPAQSLFNSEAPETLTLLFESIAKKQQTLIHYKGIQDTFAANRIIEPVGLFHEGGFWYVYAYCLKRSDYRQFRTDRIFTITSTKIPYTLQHPSVHTFLLQKKENAPKTKVRIRVDNEVVHFLKWERVHFGFESEIISEHTTEMTFYCRDTTEGFSRWFLMFADQADIIEPEELKDDIRQMLTTIQRRINKV